MRDFEPIPFSIPQRPIVGLLALHGSDHELVRAALYELNCQPKELVSIDDKEWGNSQTVATETSLSLSDAKLPCYNRPMPMDMDSENQRIKLFHKPDFMLVTGYYSHGQPNELIEQFVHYHNIAMQLGSKPKPIFIRYAFAPNRLFGHLKNNDHESIYKAQYRYSNETIETSMHPALLLALGNEWATIANFNTRIEAVEYCADAKELPWGKPFSFRAFPNYPIHFPKQVYLGTELYIS